MSKGEAVANETIKEVRNRVWVTIAGNNQVEVSAANQDPQIAYQLAQATINTFVQWKINLDRIDSVTAETFLQELIKEYRIDVKEAQQALRSYLYAHPEPVRGDRPDLELLEIQNLQAELDFAGTRLARALEKAENARLAESQVESNVSQKYTIVDAPDLPEKPAVSRRQMAMNAMIFVAAGILLSSIAVIGATLLDRSFRFPPDVSHELDFPVLAVVPDVASKKGRRGSAKKKAQAAAAPQEPIPGQIQELETAMKPEQGVEKAAKGLFR
jgi:capsular polysaccharide biosynthesis protein